MPPSRNRKRLRALRRDAADEDSALVVAYEDASGAPLAWSGDREAPYTWAWVDGITSVLAPPLGTASSPDVVPRDEHDGPVSPWFDLAGRQQTNHPQLIAGENIAHHYLGISPKPISSQQDSCEVTYLSGGATSVVAKAAPGRLYQLYVFNPTGGSLTFQLHNKASAPAAGEAAFMTPITLPTLTALFEDFAPIGGIFLPLGITFASSSAYPTFTGSSGLHITGLTK